MSAGTPGPAGPSGSLDELRTSRLVLRPFTDADRAPFAALNADPEVMRWFPALLDRAASDAFVDRIAAHTAAHGFGLRALERRADGVFLGFTGLAVPGFDAPFLDPDAPTVEVGWRLARHAWGRGYATEAARAVIAAGAARGLVDVVSFTAVGNVRSRAVMERLGLHHHPDEDFDHPALPAGHPLRRHVLYRLPRA